VEQDRGPDRLLRLISLAAIIATLVLITIGGVVRVTESGLGCPDWPLCYGKVIPPIEFHSLIEYSHRLLANVVSVLVIGLLIVGVVKYRHEPTVLRPVVLITILLVVQVGLGAWTVLAELPHELVTAHLAVAEAIFSLLVFTGVLAYQRNLDLVRSGGNERKRLDWLMPACSAGAVYLVIISGSYVVGSSATYACVSWPLCQNLDFVKWDDFLAYVNMFHRLVAGILLIILIRVVMVLWKRYETFRLFRLIGLAVVCAIVVEVALGAANPLMHFTPFVRAAHLSVATVIQGLMVALASFVWVKTRALDGDE